MAANRKSELHQPEHSSSYEDGESEEEEQPEGSSGSEEEEEDDEEEEAEEQEAVQLPPAAVPKTVLSSKNPGATQTSANPQQPSSSSSDESGSGSESESDTDTATGSDSSPEKAARTPVKNVKPLESKPMDVDQVKDSKKIKSNPQKVVPSPVKPTVTDTKSTEKKANDKSKGSKRKLELDDGEVSETKGTATNSTGVSGGDDLKKPLFQRIWSDEDEIAMLKGIIDYKDIKKRDPTLDLHDLHKFIKKTLHVEVNDAQFTSKVRRLKKKFINASSKEKQGKELNFSKPHEKSLYDLSKIIWGGEGSSAISGNDSGAKSVPGSARNKKAKDTNIATPLDDNLNADNTVFHQDDFVSLLTRQIGRSFENSAGLVEAIVRFMVSEDAGPNKAANQEEFTQQVVQECELYLEKIDFIREEVRLVLDVLKTRI